MATERTWLAGLLLFLAGALVGANAVYFLLVRRLPPPAAVSRSATRPSPPTSPAVAPPVASRTTPAPVSPAYPDAATRPTTSADVPSGLIVPVAGIAPSQLSDTFNDHRDGERIHEALDIMAPRGTPVLATADGSVAKLFTSQRGGLTIYQFDPTSTWAYYYAHLDRYAPDLVEGRQLRRGEVIGYVGSTGNADAAAPHLHFAIFVLGPEKRWWEGTAIDPYPLLTASSAR